MSERAPLDDPIAVQTPGGRRLGSDLEDFVLGRCGIDELNGVTTHVPADARVKRAAVSASQRTIAVADASKLGALAFGHVCALDALERLVTDAAVEPVIGLESAGLRVDLV